MITSEKKHSSDYLKEYASKPDTPDWLSLLIQSVIDSNGDLKNTDKEAIFLKLKEEGSLMATELTHKESEKGVIDNIETSAAPDKLVIEKITHSKGVNALISGQSITFSDAGTIIFGLNGTGKSGYFRILHELSGADKPKEILSNIYIKDEGTEVTIDFKLNDMLDTYEWRDAAIRGVEPFCAIDVFDAEYLPFYLNERENKIDIRPLGLHFFQIITGTIDEFKERLLTEGRSLEERLPSLDHISVALDSDVLKSFLQQLGTNDNDRKRIDAIQELTLRENKLLTALTHEQLTLKARNPGDTAKVLSQEKKDLTRFQNFLTRLKSVLESTTKQTATAVSDHNAKKQTRTLALKRFSVLNSIPVEDQESWEKFIQSGKEYQDQISDGMIDPEKNCIYCHQTIDGEALELVGAYSEYLLDKSQEELNTTVGVVNDLRVTVNIIPTEFELSEILTPLLAEIEQNSKKSYTVIVSDIIDKAKKQKGNLVQALTGSETIANDFALEIGAVDKFLSNQISLKETQIKTLLQPDDEKIKRLSEIQKAISELTDKEILWTSKQAIEKYESLSRERKKYSIVNKSMSTSAISKIASSAHEDLLTDSLRDAFDLELKLLDKDLDIKISKAVSEKGVVRTTMQVLGNSVKTILSEGEQKAAGIAMFITEIKHKNTFAPVVFDDPVTSLDDDVAHLLAKRIISLSAERQVIVFTHNKHFYDALIHWSKSLKDVEKKCKTHHICKNPTKEVCREITSHIHVYKVRRDDKKNTGRVTLLQEESSEYYIEKAKQELKGDYVDVAVAGYLKCAIEHFLDEKVLLNMKLIKHNLAGEPILWEKLEKIDSRKAMINEVHVFWSELSNRASHVSQESNLNPMKKEEFKKIIQYLEIARR